MRERRLMHVLLAGLLAVLLPGLAVPVGAVDVASASVSGTVHSAPDRSPVAGARLYLGDPDTGDVYPSNPTDDGGRFRVDGVPPATYEVAVGVDRGLFLVPARVTLEAGAEETLLLAVDTHAAAAARSGDESAGSGLRLWSNPFTAALIVLGSALVIGAAVESATDDEDPASPN